MVTVRGFIKKTGLLVSFTGLFFILSSTVISLTHYHGPVTHLNESYSADTVAPETDIVCEIASLRFLGTDSSKLVYDAFIVAPAEISIPAEPAHQSSFLPVPGRAPPVC